jgi:hypothetical protein
VERKPGPRERDDVARQRGFRGELFLRLPLRERRRHQPGGADRGGARRLLLHGARRLSQAGHEPDSVKTTAEVHLDKDDAGFSITRSDLTTEVKVDGLDDEEFQKHADEAKRNCPVSRALGAIEVGLEAKLA